jgi:hypothetical protein
MLKYMSSPRLAGGDITVDASVDASLEGSAPESPRSLSPTGSGFTRLGAVAS